MFKRVGAFYECNWHQRKERGWASAVITDTNILDIIIHIIRFVCKCHVSRGMLRYRSVRIVLISRIGGDSDECLSGVCTLPRNGQPNNNRFNFPLDVPQFVTKYCQFFDSTKVKSSFGDAIPSSSRKLKKIAKEYSSLPRYSDKKNCFKMEKFWFRRVNDTTLFPRLCQAACKWRVRGYVETARRSEINRRKYFQTYNTHRERVRERERERKREKEGVALVARRLCLGTMTGLITAPSHGYANFSTGAPVIDFKRCSMLDKRTVQSTLFARRRAKEGRDFLRSAPFSRREKSLFP